jgi:hypothetical protein
MTSSREFEKFDETIKKILRSDPKAVKAAISADKQERKMEAERTGKRGRGRPPKSAVSAPSSSEKD